MKNKNNLRRKINALTQSKWMHPAPIALIFVVAVLVMTGCTPHH